MQTTDDRVSSSDIDHASQALRLRQKRRFEEDRQTGRLQDRADNQ